MKLNGNTLIIGGVVLVSVLFLGFIVFAQKGKLTQVENEIVKLAVDEAGVNEEQFIKDFQSPETADAVQADIKEYDRISKGDQQSTPAIFINGEKVSAADFEPFKATVQSYITKNKDKAVELVIFEDYQCPYCSQFYPIPFQIKNAFGDKVRITHRNLPLESIHVRAMNYAKGAIAAKKQGKFKEFSRAAFEKESGTTYTVLDKLPAKAFVVED